MEINVEELRKQSRKATYIAIAASVVIVGSLYMSFHQTVGVTQNLQTTQTRMEQTSQENAALNKDVSHLKDARDKYADALNSTVSSSPEASKAFTDVIKASPELAAAIPRVFIHMNGSQNTDLAKTIRKDLKAQGFVVPIPDSIPPINGKVAAVRLHYYSEDAYSKADLVKIQAIFSKENIALIPTFIPNPPPPAPPARTYALYLGTH